MITIVESGGANISSILFALERIGVKAEWTADADKIAKASRVMLPGVGAAAEAMKQLHALELDECIKSLTCPVMGICLGMQMLFETSEEGNAKMLGIIQSPVVKFREEPDKTIPHMGWNVVALEQKDHPLVADIDSGSFFYFVHSYYAPFGNYTVGACSHGSEKFSAIVAQDNFMGCQFHPERSGAVGSKILENFSRL
ncbi:MAG TPA: imidazole glycerol phosphate synthase subunit HisH [Alphaproteobacteria bacterium]|nr:imidazole glycerol phosphate synthase subunit HisH [Alphaproteobacteria bacterium]HNS44583.1 imidazole glycerol phosphate synthase subunit HisH [Alphaproteobacteria bacterium]